MTPAATTTCSISARADVSNGRPGPGLGTRATAPSDSASKARAWASGSLTPQNKTIGHGVSLMTARVAATPST